MKHAPSPSTKTAGLNSFGLSLRGFTKQSLEIAASKTPRNDGKSGQSLAEILIATAIIAIFIGGVAGAVSVSLQVLGQNKYLQSASLLAQEILDNATVVANSDWHRVDRFGGDALSSAPAQYKVIAPAPFTIASGAETVTLDGIDYTRYFTVDLVSRDAGKNIEVIYDPSREDPSTLKITGTVTWTGGGVLNLTRYVTRSRNRSTLQTDWSGGAGQSGAFADPAKYDSASAGIDVAGKSGSIRLSGIPY